MPDIVQDSGSGDMSLSFDTTSEYLELPQNLKHITSGTLSY